MKSAVNKEITYLNLSNDILKKLNSKNINSIEDLWNLKRSDLKKFLTDKEITEIIIKMQLIGLDLNRKVYKFN